MQAQEERNLKMKKSIENDGTARKKKKEVMIQQKEI